MCKHFCMLMEQVSQIGKIRLLVQKILPFYKIVPPPPLPFF